jgi:RsiW-degrading membrane proteinase PrsW (M82 family)
MLGRRMAGDDRGQHVRLVVGGLLYFALMAAGAALVLALFIIPPLTGPQADARLAAMITGAFLAFPPLAIYLWLPWVVDRFDPEPWWCLALALLWGGVAAAGFSGLINTGALEATMAIAGGTEKEAATIGEFVAACISAPLVEEFWKGLAIFGFFFFLRREFDGVVDGIIYGTFCALGFAATENVIYYSRAQLTETLGHHHGALATTFILRGILAPWGHPLYTSMTGIGFGVARETTKPWLRWCAPLFGYFAAVFLHSVWNTASSISGMLFIVMLPLWFLFVLAFFALTLGLVVRKGRIIRENLRDEVLLGALTQPELDLICSPFGRLKATFGHGGAAGRRFVAHGARLGLCKWHAARAMKSQKMTVSMQFIVPLRQELARLRHEMLLRKGVAPAPAPGWQPPQGPPRV